MSRNRDAASRRRGNRGIAGRRVTGRRLAERRGRLAERLALALLMFKGYRILERRYKTPVGEIDIIAQKRSTLVFVEVKARRRMEDAIESIGGRQRQRITRAAEAYLARHPAHAGRSCRFDAILVARGRLPRHLIDAWRCG